MNHEQTMCRRTYAFTAVAIATLSSTASAGPVWSAAERSAFVAGCAIAIVAPAKRDYAAAAERAGDANPKPFPEDQLRDSVEPMCACLADRLVEDGISDMDTVKNKGVVVPMIQEAMAGGRCKPGGLLGQILSQTPRAVKPR